DEAALGAALLRVAEHVERRAAQTPHAREDSEGAEYPGAIGALAQLPARRIARGEERRRQMKPQPEVALELLVQVGKKRAVGIEARPLVLVLVGHQLEEIVRGRLGETAFARRARFLRLLDGGDRPAISPRIPRALVIGQEGGAPRDDIG